MVVAGYYSKWLALAHQVTNNSSHPQLLLLLSKCNLCVIHIRTQWCLCMFANVLKGNWRICAYAEIIKVSLFSDFFPVYIWYQMEQWIKAHWHCTLRENRCFENRIGKKIYFFFKFEFWICYLIVGIKR